MSSNVMSYGIMVPLDRKLTKEEREEWQEILWEQDSPVHLSYYNDMAYTEEHGDEYGISFGELHPVTLEDFNDLKQFDIWIEEDKARSYRELWYNGADSEHDLMTKEEFLKRTKQE